MDKRSLLFLLLILSGGIFLGLKTERNPDMDPKLSMSSYCPSPATEKTVVNVYDMQAAFTEVVKKVRPSLVNISAVHVVELDSPFFRFYYGNPFNNFFDDMFGKGPEAKKEKEKYRYEGMGSGFIVDTKGYVITNYHVIRDADNIKVITSHDKQYDAEIVGADEKTDLAVLKIKSSRKFTSLELGDSDKLQVGNLVMAAGSPFGLQQTYTMGILSAVRQNVHVENNNYRDMLQTDASINQGNSGGPLVDIEGRVIGINTAIFAPTGVFSGVGFAIPINPAKKILRQLIEKGKVIRSWLGVEIQDIDAAIEKSFGLSDMNGALVNAVMKDSPASRSEIKRGDIITKVDNISVKNSSDLQDKISSTKPGTVVSLTIIRDSRTIAVQAKLDELPSDNILSREQTDRPGHTSVCRGITVSELNDDLRNMYGIKARSGVLVTDIDPSSNCYDIGLEIGDLITEINRNKITTFADFIEIFSEYDLTEGIVFDIIRNGKAMYISYRAQK